MKRPLVWILLFLIAGIFMGRYLQNSIAFLLLIVVFLTVILYYRFRQNMIMLFPIALLLGFVAIVSGLSYEHKNIERLARDISEISVEATILDVGKTNTGNYKAIVQAEKFTDKTGTIYKENMKVQVYFDEGLKVKTGEKVILKGTVNPLECLRNPGGYNEFQHLRSRKIKYKIYAEDVQKIGEANIISVIFPTIREKLSLVFDKALPKNEAEIMKSIIIGDKGGIEDSIKDLYKGAGIYHILAISGLHVSIVMLYLNGLLSLIFRKTTTSIIMIAFLCFYCILTGAGIATTRAVIMCIVTITGGLLNRRGDAVVTISFAAICLLVYEPFYLWDIGFQYSFAAVYGLAVGTPAIERSFVLIISRFPFTEKFFSNKFLKKHLTAAIAIFLAIMPINIYHFYYFTPISILTNLLIAPTVFILIVIGFMMCIIGLFFGTIAKFIAIIVIAVLKIYEIICIIAIRIPFSTILTGRISFYILLLFYCMLGLAYYMLYSKGDIMKIRKKYFYISSIVFVSVLAILWVYPKRLKVEMLDVGQGDSIVISKGKANFIIDGGGNGLKGLGDNTGKNIVVPYLDSLGITTVDAAFVTHTDADHAIGIIETMERKNVKKLFLPSRKSEDENEKKYYKILLETAKKYNTEVYYISKNDEMIFDKNIIIKCLFPDKDKNLSANDSSMVLKIDYGKASFLFMGDVGFESEKAILANGVNIESDVLKIAHHGSKYSTSEDFIEAVSPSVAIISAGRNNTYGHPSEIVLEKLENEDINVYTTPKNGAILINSDGENIFIRGMLD